MNDNVFCIFPIKISVPYSLVKRIPLSAKSDEMKPFNSLLALGFWQPDHPENNVLRHLSKISNLKV